MENGAGPYLLLRCLWPFFDSTNILYTRASFLQLLASHATPFLIDLSRIKYVASMWPPCVGPLGEDTEEFKAMYAGRWALTGVHPKVRIVLEMLGLTPGCVDIVQGCPSDGGMLDLARGTCSIHGPFRTVEWGPNSSDEELAGVSKDPIMHPHLEADSAWYSSGEHLAAIRRAAIVQISPPRGYWAERQWASLSYYLRFIGAVRLVLDLHAVPELTDRDLKCLIELDRRFDRLGGLVVFAGTPSPGSALLKATQWGRTMAFAPSIEEALVLLRAHEGEWESRKRMGPTSEADPPK